MPKPIRVPMGGRWYLVEYHGDAPALVKVEIPATDRRAIPWARTLWGRHYGVRARGVARKAIEAAELRRLLSPPP